MKKKKNPLQLDFWADEEAALWDVMLSFIVDGYMDGAGGGVNLLPPEMRVLVDWDVVNSAALEFAKNYRYTWIKDLTDTTRAHVQRAMTDWINSGEPLEALEIKLAPMFSPARAARIAATEVTRIYAQGNGDAWESTGYINASRWNTAVDELVCPICEPLNGQIIGVGDIDAYPPAHPNCRCWLTPIVDEEALKEQTERILGL